MPDEEEEEEVEKGRRKQERVIDKPYTCGNERVLERGWGMKGG